MTKERTYRDALLDISTFFNGNPARWPEDGDAIDRLIAIADKALDAGERASLNEPSGYSQEYADQMRQALCEIVADSQTSDRVRQFAHKGLLPSGLPVKS